MAYIYGYAFGLSMVMPIAMRLWPIMPMAYAYGYDFA